MKRIPVEISVCDFPEAFHSFLEGAAVFDSSCSANAQVWFLDKGEGFYLKAAPKGSLRREAALTGFFHEKGLAAEVLAYESLEKDWLLTCRVPGEDCTYGPYLDDPVRLCDTTAELLRTLHETDPAGCPVPNQTANYLALARQNHAAGQWDLRYHFPDWAFQSPEEAWAAAEENGKYLKADTLLHGDYCLPNIMLDNWRFSGFIDLDHGGVGDRHVDLFWGIWSLWYNLKSHRYRERFLDAYGREAVSLELLRTVAAFEVFG